MSLVIPEVVTEKILCSWIRNPFKPDDASTLMATMDHIPGVTVAQYVQMFTGKTGEFIAAVNGKHVAPDQILQPWQHLTVVLMPEGGENNFFRMLAMIAVVVMATYASAGTATMPAVTAMSATGAAMAQGFVFAAVMVAGSFLVNSLLPAANMDQLDDRKKSPNYGWSSQPNAWQEGISLPSLIGERTFAPPRIGSYRHLPDEDKKHQRLRMLFALCEDPIDPIDELDIFINDRPSNHYPGFYFDYTSGKLTETRVSKFFQDTIVEVPVGQELLDTTSVHQSNHSYTLTTTYGNRVNVNSNPITAAMFVFYTKKPYYLVESGGDNLQWAPVEDTSFSIRIRYRRYGTSDSWTYVTVPNNYLLKGTRKTYELRGLSLNTYEFEFAYVGSHGSYDTQLKGVTGYSNISGLPTRTTSGAVDNIEIGLLFPGGVFEMDKTTGGFLEHSIPIHVAVRQYDPGSPNAPWPYSRYFTVTGKKSDSFRRVVQFDELPPATYEIQCFVSGTRPTAARYSNTVQWEYIKEGIDQSFTYRGVATLGIELVASEALQGGWPTVQVKAKRSDYYDGGQTRSSKNPAWAAYYRLTRIYKVPTSKINFDNFSAWASYCDTNSLTVALYLDTPMGMKSVLQQIGLAGRATIMPRGGKWDVIIEDTAAPAQLFSSDNIIEDSFEEEFIPSTEFANTVIVWFFDKDNSNRKTPIKVRDPNIPATEDEKIHEETLYGVDNFEQAKKHAITLLNQTRLIRRRMSWVSDVDAINCQTGDVVYLQNDTPIWGLAAGRVTSATSNTVTCDIPLNYNDPFYNTPTPKEMRILIRHLNPRTDQTVDFIERLTINNPYPNQNVVTYTLTSGTFERTPSVGDMITIGWKTGNEISTSDELLSIKQVRVIGMERYAEQQFKINAVDYYDDAYEDSYIISTIPPVESGLVSMRLQGNVGFNIIGQTQYDYIRLNWDGAAAIWYIFYRTNNGGVYDTEWTYHSSTSSNTMVIKDLPSGFTYQFTVSDKPYPDLTAGSFVEIAFGPIDHGSIIGEDTPSGLHCVQTGNQTWTGRDLELTWDAWTGFSIKGYVVEFIHPANSTTILRTEKTETNSFIYTLAMNAADIGSVNAGYPNPIVKVRLRVIDQNSNESNQTSIVTFTNAPPSDITSASILTKAGHASQFTGRDLEITWSPSGDEDFLCYFVDVWNSGVNLRSETIYTEENIIAPSYAYTYEKNQADNGGTAKNSIQFNVYAMDVFGQFSEVPGQKTFTNPAPGIVQGLSFSPWMGGIQFTWNKSTEIDFDYFEYKLSVEGSAWPETYTPINHTKLNYFLNETQYTSYQNAEVVLRIRQRDTFGSYSNDTDYTGETGSLYINPTGLDDFDDLSSIWPNIPVLRNFTWTNNSPSSGYIAWSTGDIYYGGVKYTISASNTNLHWVYWTPTQTVFMKSAADTEPPAGSFVIATNIGGTVNLAWNNAIANQVIGSAWIRDASIVNAKIANLAVTNAKISNLEADRIEASKIKTEELAITNFSTTLRDDIENSNQQWTEIINRPSDFQIKNNLLDPSQWVLGTTGTQGSFIGYDATERSIENSIVLGIAPHNGMAPLWECKPVNGGTNQSGFTYDFSGITHNQTLRFIVWLKRTTSLDGINYFGFAGANALTLTGEAVGGGSDYFRSAFDPPAINKWYLLVGYLHPYSYSGSSVGGLYDPETGLKVVSHTDFKLKSGVTTQTFRAFFAGYTADTARTYWYGPAVHICDGNEPSIESILAMASNGGIFNKQQEWTDIQNKPDEIHQIFYRSTAPTADMSTGDYWIDTDDKKLYCYISSTWTPIQDAGIQAALDAADDAAELADEKIKTYWQTSKPSLVDARLGDLWFDTDSTPTVNQSYRFNGTDFVQIDLPSDWTKIYGTGKPADNADVTEHNLHVFRTFQEYFENPNNTTITKWSEALSSGTGELSIVTATSATDSVAGGKYLRVGNNSGNDSRVLVYNKSIPFDPNKLYRIKARVRRTAGTGIFYAGVAGRNYTDTEWVSTLGTNVGNTSQHYVAANGYSPSSTWTEYIGYLQGSGTTFRYGTDATQIAPSNLHTNARYFRPFVAFNQGSATGIMELDEFSVDIMPDTLDFDIIDGTNKPANGATVGAAWGTNLTGIPARFADDDTPNASGIYATPNFLGFYHHPTTNWPVQIANVGGYGKFYIGVNSPALKYLSFDSQVGSFTIQGADFVLTDGTFFVGDSGGTKWLYFADGELDICGTVTIKNPESLPIQSGNLVKNSGFAGAYINGVAGTGKIAAWTTTQTSSNVSYGVDYSASWIIPNGHSAYLRQADATGSGYARLYQDIAVVVGKKYCLSAYVIGYQCSVRIFLQFLDGSNNTVGSVAYGTTYPRSALNGTTLTNYTRASVFGTAAAGAVKARIYLDKFYTDQGQGYSSSIGFFTNVMFSEVQADQTDLVLPPYSDSFDDWRSSTDMTKIDGGKIYTGSVTTFSSTGGIICENGGDIILKGADSNPGYIMFDGTYDVQVGLNAAGTSLEFIPSANDTITMMIGKIDGGIFGGSTARYFKSIDLNATDAINLFAVGNAYVAWLNMYSGGASSRIDIGSGYYNVEWYMDDNEYRFQPGVNSNNTVSLGKSGRVFTEVWATDSTINTSDLRKKENISDTPLGLDFISKLRPISFKWKNYYRDHKDSVSQQITQKEMTYSRQHHGFIAQEIKAVLDEMKIDTSQFAGYIYDTEKDFYALRLGEFIAPIVKAIQELNQKIELIKERVKQ